MIVKFLVSVHLAFGIIRFVVTVVFEVLYVSEFNKFVRSNHETFDKGLLVIFRVNTTLLVSFTIVTSFSSINGLSVSKNGLSVSKKHNLSNQIQNKINIHH